MVRGWAAYMIGGCALTSLPRILESVQPLANDGHFCVREWAWLAVRPRIAQDLDEAISILSKWTASPSEYIRRFASEATRPRGVWSAHLPVLKKEPYRGLPILEPLRADVAPYVQNSVANWLNDAAKTRPDWVVELCHSWLSEKPSSATQHIGKRARRSIPSK